MSKKDEKLKPILLRDPKTNEVMYTLEFTRHSVQLAEKRGFVATDIFDKPASMIPELFFYSFLANHKNMTKSASDKVLDEMLGGKLSAAAIERLSGLYAQVATSHILGEDEETPKNAQLTVEL